MSRNQQICDCNVIHEEAVDAVTKKMPEDRYFLNLSGFYKMLADNTRCKIIYALYEQELCVCDLSNVLSMTKSSISHQLSKMKENGVVKSRREGKEVFYSLDDNHVEIIFNMTQEHISHTKEAGYKNMHHKEGSI